MLFYIVLCERRRELITYSYNLPYYSYLSSGTNSNKKDKEVKDASTFSFHKLNYQKKENKNMF